MLVLFLLLIAGWSFCPYNPIYFYPDHLQTEKEKYKVGDELIINAHFYKNSTPAPIFVSRWYENSIIFPLPVTPIQSQKGENRMHRSYFIPEFFENDNYRLCELVKYQVNPIRVIEYRNCSNFFQVIAD